MRYINLRYYKITSNVLVTLVADQAASWMPDSHSVHIKKHDKIHAYIHEQLLFTLSF